MKMKMKSVYSELKENGIKVKPIRYKTFGMVTAIGFDAWNKEGMIEFEPDVSTQNCYKVAFTSYTNPHKYSINKNWKVSFYSNKKDGNQPVMTEPISVMKKEIREFFKLNKT